MSTTAVADKDLPPPEVTLVNAPETIEEAILRIQELEMRLEDLCRAAEIVSITKQMEIIDSFTQAGLETLKTKIQTVQPGMEDFKLTIITNKKDE